MLLKNANIAKSINDKDGIKVEPLIVRCSSKKNPAKIDGHIIPFVE